MREFNTSNLVLAACLLMFGEEPVRVEMEGRRCVFVFVHTDNLKAVFDQLRDKQLKVEPTAFSNAMRDIKVKMYREIDNSEEIVDEKKNNISGEEK